MNKTFGLIFLAGLFFFAFHLKAQNYSPVFSFADNVISHTAHITYLKGYYYTCNGGNVDDGKVSIFDNKGKLISSYAIKLDMRSIAYNEMENSFYVSTKDKQIYVIKNFEKGEVELVYSKLYEDGNSAITFSPDGKWLYIFDHGTLKKFHFRKGTLKSEVSGLLSGEKASTGSNAMAFDGKYIYTWDSSKKIIYCYSKKGKFIRSFKIQEGDFGYTLSFANGYIFVATDADNNSKGVWHAYSFW